MGDLMHEIDLSKYNLRTDLIIEKIDDETNLLEYEKDRVKVSKIILDEKNKLGKKKGQYITISFDDVTDTTNFNNVLNVLVVELEKMLKELKITDDKTCLVVGLGNINATPDALGGKLLKMLRLPDIYIYWGIVI